MEPEEAQKEWDEDYERIKNRHLAQAKIINAELEKNFISSYSDLFLDFTCFTKDEVKAKGIREKLFEFSISIRKEDDYYFIDGSSQPHTINMTPQQHLDWIKYIHGVALKFGCIFVTWSIKYPEKNQVWTNENIETEFD
jgi:hypothetical protein